MKPAEIYRRARLELTRNPRFREGNLWASGRVSYPRRALISRVGAEAAGELNLGGRLFPNSVLWAPLFKDRISATVFAADRPAEVGEFLIRENGREFMAPFVPYGLPWATILIGEGWPTGGPIELDLETTLQVPGLLTWLPLYGSEADLRLDFPADCHPDLAPQQLHIFTLNFPM